MTSSRKQDIAIVGMSCIYPGAPDLETFWSNIVRGRDAIRSVESEWDTNLYYDKNASGHGKTYSKRGGFITEYAEFNALEYGVMPNVVSGSDPDQFLTLKVAVQAMRDAGYGGEKNKKLDLDRAEIILGRISAPGSGSINLIEQSKTMSELGPLLKKLLPEVAPERLDEALSSVKAGLIPSTADNIPGAMPNVLAGRVAQRLGFRGRNMLVDAACASSMVAVETAVDDLLSGRCDLALAGGVHVNSSALFFQMFSGLGALSRADSIRPFDDAADGTLLGEGVGILVLKRLEDALSEGHRIYAVIKAVASSSDGHGSSVLAPSADGEELAMRKAYSESGINPLTVELLEAHGTGTPVGDAVELEAVRRVFAHDGEAHCAIGSVKSMIGHCQSASAVAGIIKTALALHHKILPATLNVSTPTRRVDWRKHPCYINSVTRPWIRSKGREERRAAVSAFGFGGINAHMVLAEHVDQEVKKRDKLFAGAALSKESGAAVSTENLLTATLEQDSKLVDFDCEVFALAADTKEALQAKMQQCASAPSGSLRELAAAHTECKGEYRLAIVADDLSDLRDKLAKANTALASGRSERPYRVELLPGVYFGCRENAPGGDLAFLYPGLGSAYTGMLADLCMYFPEVREVFEIVDSVAIAAGALEPPSKSIFPPPFSGGERAVPALLGSADFAVVAVLLAEYAMYHLLEQLNVKPDMLMGCSTGEFAAITTTGSVDVLSAAKNFYQLSTRVARSIPEEALADLSTLRTLTSWEKIRELGAEDIFLSADLGDDHVIVTGATATIQALAARLKDEHIASQLLPEPIPYHTPLVESIIDANHEAVQSVDIKPLSIPGYSCSTASLYPSDEDRMRATFVELFTRPIALRTTVQKMYEDGARIFVEVGPNGVLSSAVAGILDKEPHAALPTNLASRSGLRQLLHMLAALACQGVPVDFSYLYKRRGTGLSTTLQKTGRLLDLRHRALDIPEASVITGLASEQTENDSDSGDEIMSRFLSVSAQFYDKLNQTSEAVLASYLSTREGLASLGPVERDIAGDDENRLLNPPFIERAEVISLDLGADTELSFRLSLETDRYLLDHAIGGNVTTSGGRVYLVPLMVTLEIMAEAAALHAGAGTPSRVENTRAYKRIVVPDFVEVRAKVTGADGRYAVTLTDSQGERLSSADFVFADFAEAPVPSIVRASGQPARLTSRELLYGDRPDTMFHGGRMQAVQSIDAVSEKLIAGSVAAGPASDWTDEDAGGYLLHPLLLDNASQLVLFYLYEKELPAPALLPFLIESVEYFAQPADFPAVVEVRAQLTTLSERATEASIEVIDGDRVLLKITGINSRRVILDETMQNLVSTPAGIMLGTTHETGLPGSLVHFSSDTLPKDEVLLDWCLDYILTQDELKLYNRPGLTRKRKSDWLAGRIAAKRAVADFVECQGGPRLCPQDITLDGDARPRVSTALLLPEIDVSISHTEGGAWAFASTASLRLGVDCENVRERESDFATTFMSTREVELLQAEAVSDRARLTTMLWCAKEAAYKAHHGDILMSTFETASFDFKDTGEVVLMSEAGEVVVRFYNSGSGDEVLALVVPFVCADLALKSS